jgi:hypothetical protein
MGPEDSDGDDLRDTITSVMDGEEVEYIETTADDPDVGKTVEIDEEGNASVDGEPRVRDSLGRFVAKPKGPEVASEGAAAPAPATPQAGLPTGAPGAPQPGAVASAPPPPQSWSPSAREHWAAMPPAVQQEVHRREVEMQRYVNDTAGARHVAERFYQTVQPFLPTIQAEGVDAITAVSNLMQFATRMRMGTPAEKAITIAALVKSYGVDVHALDSALVGQLPTETNPQASVQAAVQQALAPIYQAAQARQQQITQQAAWGARSEMEAFAQDPKHEFFNDLRGTMADMIEVAERQGREMSLQEAYQRAALLHPEVSKVIIARQQGNQARQLTAAAQRAKAAAVSVRGSAPVGSPNGPEPSSIRESIEAAIESHSRL